MRWNEIIYKARWRVWTNPQHPQQIIWSVSPQKIMEQGLGLASTRVYGFRRMAHLGDWLFDWEGQSDPILLRALSGGGVELRLEISQKCFWLLPMDAMSTHDQTRPMTWQEGVQACQFGAVLQAERRLQPAYIGGSCLLNIAALGFVAAYTTDAIALLVVLVALGYFHFFVLGLWYNAGRNKLREQLLTFNQQLAIRSDYSKWHEFIHTSAILAIVVGIMGVLIIATMLF